MQISYDHYINLIYTTTIHFTAFLSSYCILLTYYSSAILPTQTPWWSISYHLSRPAGKKFILPSAGMYQNTSAITLIPFTSTTICQLIILTIVKFSLLYRKAWKHIHRIVIIKEPSSACSLFKLTWYLIYM